MLLKYANNAGSTLQSGISATATTAVLATGTGGIFPTITGDQSFFLTFQDAATQQVNEIVRVTAIAGDAITIQRGQQGTTQRAWGAGDFARELVTMGDAANFVQPDQIQQGAYTVATPGGTVNNLTASLAASLQALPDMLSFTMPSIGPNTGNVTLTLTFATSGVTLAAHPLKKLGGSQLNAGDIPAAGAPLNIVWSQTLAAFILTNPGSGTAGSVNGGVANNLLVQTAPNTTGFVPAPTVAGQVLGFIGGVISWVVAAVTSFNGRGGAVMPQAGDYNAAQVGAVPKTAFDVPFLQQDNPLYGVFPGPAGQGTGIIIQAGHRPITPNTDTDTSFPFNFPGKCVAVVVSCDNQSAAIKVDPAFYTVATFRCRVNASNISWIAVGF